MRSRSGFWALLALACSTLVAEIIWLQQWTLGQPWFGAAPAACSEEKV